MEIEEWKDIESYEGLYQISTFGRVRSLHYYGADNRTEIMKQRKTWKGYYMVHLRKKSLLVHRLVAQVFIPNPLNLPQVNHKNENKEDNHASNLEWMSCKDNINFGTGVKRRALAQSKSYDQFTLDGVFIRRFKGKTDLKEHGFCPSCVLDVCNNRMKAHKGFVWKYV